MWRRLARPVPAGRLHRFAVAVVVSQPVAVRKSLCSSVGPALDPPLGLAVGLAVGASITIGLSFTRACPATTTVAELMLAMRSSETPFLDSVERRRPGTSLRGYVMRTLPHSSAIVVANRAPHEPRPEGGFTRGAGGVITALLTLAEVAAADWVACARTDGERALIEEHGTTWNAPLIRSETRLHYATPTPEQYEQYYSVISNPVLWFVQHYLWDLAHQPVINGRIHRAWKNGYVEVNKQVARKVVEVARGLPGRPLVMVHDYQLYLVPKLVREQLNGAIIQHFVHIPWPTPQYWKVLPREMRDAILHGLLGCDIVGFQTSLDVRNFLMTCEENAGLAVDEREKAVLVDGRVVYARAYPISIDVASTTRLSYSHGVMVEERKLRDWRPEHLIVRIDRTDPSKNIVRGFLSYEKLLAHHPELKGRVQFWAFLQPSRQDVAVYRNYVRKVRQTVQRINAQYGAHGWQPIRLELGESVRKAMAAMRNFDVLVVNSVYDGLNLVAKEGALINRSDGVIVLSENVGAHEELHQHVLSVNPFDIEATANAMHQAIVMGVEEKRRLNEGARDVVRSNDIARWITRQVQDIRDLAAAPGLRAG
ncbi:MAG: trehalose-6-phosphate synthase [Chloroflexi bacterium]|nr:MAG: trehalose-6-phosphate synthase [Chloroflexota bacterium]